jgi:UDP-N-acetylmuramate--alanine ligase
MDNIHNEKILSNVKKVFLIGIGGIGMSGIAEFLARQGYDVSGSDITLTSITKRLESFGVKIFEGHSENNLSDDVDLVIYTSAVKEDNEELIKAKRLNIKLIKRAEMLGHIVNDLFLISVSGSHGKTTTSAMISKVLIDNNYDPTVFVGGSFDFFEGGSSRIGKSKYAVVEADEYDKSFLTLSSNVIVVTSIEKDHTDIYEDVEDLKNNFKKFCDKRKARSKIIGYGDDKNVVEVLSSYTKSEKIFYGTGEGNNVRAENINYIKQGVHFKTEGVDIEMIIPGEHNVLNALAAMIACKEVGINVDSFKESIKKFPGVQRRLQLKFDGKIKIYDDYAHHPTEVEASLKAIRKTNPERIITVFQPHLYSRTNDFYREFAESLIDTDILILAKIYPAREKEIKGVSSELIYKEYKKISSKSVFYIDEFEKIKDKLNSIIEEGDVIIFQGAGDVTNLCDGYVKHFTNAIVSA